MVNGTYNVNGAFGGNIKSTAPGAKVVVCSSATLSVTSKEGNSGGTTSTDVLNAFNGGTFYQVFNITETARFGAGTLSETVTPKTFTRKNGENTEVVNYNDIVRSYSGGQSLAKGTTYTYNGSAWN